jgi:hypothetical protein
MLQTHTRNNFILLNGYRIKRYPCVTELAHIYSKGEDITKDISQAIRSY